MILIDTAPLVALCDARDSHYRTATGHLKRLASSEFGVCEAVLMEACVHLPHRTQRQRLRALLERLEIVSIPGTDDRGFWFDVLDWLTKYADHDPDWTDGCIAVLCGRDTDLSVWTYDREFRTTWRRPNGTAIPLAVRA
jgi:predicted nucleic acid-binding protein